MCRVRSQGPDLPAAQPIARSRVSSDLANSCRRAFERPAGHGEDQIAPIVGAVDDVLHRIDRRHCRLGCGAERFIAWRRAVEDALGVGNTPWIDFDAAERKPRLTDLAAVETIHAN